MQASKSSIYKTLAGYLYFILVLVMAVLLINKVMAAEQQTSSAFKTSIVKSYSTGGLAAEMSQQQAKQLLSKAKQNQTVLKSSTKVRDSAQQLSDYSADFDIFTARSKLITDWDYDGYYHQFSVTFDADVQRERARVYAVLYLSRDGGPWQQYYETDTFTIYGDSTHDSYEVFTTLADGYPSDDYNVLIDLYEVGDPIPVASISDLDTNELYALPLEDEYRDEEDNEVYFVAHESHGGSFSWGILVLFTIVFVIRELKFK